MSLRKEILKLLILRIILMVDLMQNNILRDLGTGLVLTLLWLRKDYYFLQER